ncbi:MAG: hypothetical protein IPH62_06795 [Ignavibacteriae bacterium]|nr:hypothetical protein [Ignavibacteriota bacterium]
MPTITVTVLRNDEPVNNHRVTLEVNGLAGGMKGPEYTDTHGVAEFDVEYGQEGDIFVDGNNEGSWGSYGATDVTVNL